MLVAEDICVTLGSTEILNSVSTHLKAGEITTLIGPNGAGKSTLFAALAADVEPTAGRVVLDGQNIGKYNPKELALKRAVLPQDQVVRFSYSVEEIVELARLSHETSPDEDSEIITNSLDRAEVEHLRLRDVQTLSGGEMSRAGFARVLAQTTPVLLLDEPTAALDLRHQELVLRNARQLRDFGACVVIVLHDLNLAAAYSDRVIMMADGHIVADGTPEEVFTAERIEEVYRQPVVVTSHPTRDCPLILSTD
ncbi:MULTISPECIES: heme ABC transporter ATP-binding protein [unclassified Corynebacterium]|jgi:iron complex transport system ATP-binding protein|uniref:heme ABC transporter ATP-binding protein n=1 Tax=unclassified Corynebacterium TaxID=2624378 RepID=UPI000CF84D95|nr:MULTISPECIES: heme ABC transporter ATP-binding protein [unclassified Corynebacterium]NWO17130.1 heme ABC transporter ATP-binding protein [Corynebacterium sp.]PQM73457.1 heme ABC transporter ATP-binding protein [Corynebacterium sp. J010B-136]